MARETKGGEERRVFYEADSSESFQRGLKTRREVLGDEYVEASLNKATDFSWPIQKLATEYCWDAIWNRPGLSRRDRSILNLGMISVLNRQHELRAHIRGALNNGMWPRGYKVEASMDGKTWGVPLAEGQGQSNTVVIDFNKPTKAKFIRVTQTAADPTFAWEIQKVQLFQPPAPAIVTSTAK